MPNPTPFEKSVNADAALASARAAVQRARLELKDRKQAVIEARDTLEIAQESLADAWADKKAADAATARTA
jgi:hypothetical protein